MPLRCVSPLRISWKKKNSNTQLHTLTHKISIHTNEPLKYTHTLNASDPLQPCVAHSTQDLVHSKHTHGLMHIHPANQDRPAAISRRRALDMAVNMHRSNPTA